MVKRWKTWLSRGVTIVVVAVVVGAWGWSLASSGEDAKKSPPKVERETTHHFQHHRVHHAGDPVRPQHRRTRDAGPSDVSDLPTDSAVDVVDLPSDTPSAPDSTDPGSPSQPTHTPSHTPSNPPSTPPPSSPPTDPAPSCTDLPAVLDCVLDPITGHP
ncbi:hypothetical protein [Nocardioides sp. MH1]|uniref:hypothetical protein n=1 Tax=Nocardioides sp. MH1 TaxID=3242490 RepID=UPI003521BBBB